jgi:glycosyltransferase involved in cell wall biosynthesis
MTILHIQKFKGISGSENHLLDLLPALNSEIPCEFLALEEPGYPQTEFLKRFEERGIRVHRMILQRAFSPALIWKLSRFIKAGGYELVHTHLIHADINAGFAAFLAGVPSVSSKHGWDIYDRLSRAQTWLLRLASKLPKKIITISNALVPFVTKVEAVPLSKITVIHYGLNPPPVKDFGDEVSFKSSQTQLLYVGRLVPEKGVFELLDAMASVLRDGLSVSLDMAGTGPLQEALAARIQELGIGAQVKLLGFCTDVMALERSHHALILPTYGEGFGLVCLEAMAAKRAVLASQVTSLPEIVVDGVTGLLFEARSAAAIVAAIKQVAGQNMRLWAMGEAGHQRLLSDFTQGKMVAKTLALYREILQKKP